MANNLRELLESVVDETTFLRFLTALREDCESHERDCPKFSYYECAIADHFETHSTRDFLRSMEDWGTRGDFAEGVHHGEPILRRIATMLYVGRGLRVEDRPQRG
ncbi:MAG: hypothetical protein JWO56_2190 [Acidobacteria bacterium]|nr:hypothetical protein [Acidobacteriota bacterium]